MPVMQIRIMGMFVCHWIMCMNMRMPFALRDRFIIMQMRMMFIGVLMVMDVFHNDMCMHMFVRKKIGNDNSKS